MFDYHRKVLRKIVKWVLKNGMGGADWWNINIPAKPTKIIKIVRTSEIGYYSNMIDKKENHFVIFGYPEINREYKSDTDAYNIKESIVITPCTVDFTNHKSLENIKSLETDLKLEEV